MNSKLESWPFSVCNHLFNDFLSYCLLILLFLFFLTIGTIFKISAIFVPLMLYRSMALQKYAPSGNAPSVNIKHLSFSSKVPKKAELDEANPNHNMDVDIDLREIYFLIMHFLSAGPCHKTYIQFWNELLEHQLLPRRYHAWYSRTGACSGDKDDDGLSFPLNYNMLVERYIYVLHLLYDFSLIYY